MKLKKTNVLVYTCALLCGALLLIAPQKCNYTQIQLSMYIMKVSIVWFGIWFCMKEE